MTTERISAVRRRRSSAHWWNEDIADMSELEKLKARLAEVEKKIDEAPRWGAYVAVLGEGQRALKRRIAAMSASQ